MKPSKFFNFVFFVISFFAFLREGFADSTKDEFTYIRAKEVNVRAGPSKRYPIKWVVKYRGEPMKLLSEFEDWKKVKDIDGDEGWIHKSMLNKSKHGILVSHKEELLFTGPYDNSRPIARLKYGVRFKVQKCVPAKWCLISIEGLNGWILQKKIWGIQN